MRKSKLEVTDFNELAAIVGRCPVLRIAFVDEGEPYVVPVNFGYTAENGKLTFYVHGARAGRKYELACKSPSVGFELDGALEIIRRAGACGWTAAYESVMGQGRLTVVQDADERIRGLDTIMAHYGFEGKPQYDAKDLTFTTIFKIEVMSITGKRHPR